MRLLIFTDRIRKHPLGSRIGKLLASAAQWQDFFGPTGLDPIMDVDRILLAGPQFKDSSEVVAVLKVNVPGDRLKTAVETLVARDPAGMWLDAGVPAARAAADNAERLIVMPASDIVIIAPPRVQKQALALGPNVSFPAPQGGEALSTYVITPSRALAGIFEIPKTIKWVRMKLTATSDGGAVATLIAEDASPELAAEDAKALEGRINFLTQGHSIFGQQITPKYCEPLTLTAQGKEIHGSVSATKAELEPLLEQIAKFANAFARSAAKKAAAKAAAAAAADAGAPPDARVADPREQKDE